MGGRAGARARARARAHSMGWVADARPHVGVVFAQVVPYYF